MATDLKNESRTIGKEATITRIIDAPRELVFKAWTEPKQLAQWWGPKGFTNPVCEVDARPGGKISIHMHWVDLNKTFPMTGVFHEVTPPERLVFTSTALEEKGKELFNVHNIITFTEKGGKTTVTVRAKVENAPAETKPMLDGMEEGWSQSLIKLAELLKK